MTIDQAQVVTRLSAILKLDFVILTMSVFALILVGGVALDRYDARKRLDALESRVAQSESHWRDFIAELHRLTHTNVVVQQDAQGDVRVRFTAITNEARIGVPKHSGTNVEAPALPP